MYAHTATTCYRRKINLHDNNGITIIIMDWGREPQILAGRRHDPVGINVARLQGDKDNWCVFVPLWSKKDHSDRTWLIELDTWTQYFPLSCFAQSLWSIAQVHAWHGTAATNFHFLPRTHDCMIVWLIDINSLPPLYTISYRYGSMHHHCLLAALNQIFNLQLCGLMKWISSHENN